jgi:hypothetical protein
MVANAAKISQAAATSALVADDISQFVYKSWDEMFSMSRQETEAFQLGAARRRFEALAPQVAALKDQADQNGVTKLNSLSDLIPLLFNHTVYKSYPMSLLEKNRFDMLTKWLSRTTSIDLSGVDVSKVDSIDDWMGALEAQTPLQMYHTSGTTGKLSFIPRTTLERDMMSHSYLHGFSRGFGSEPSTRLGHDDLRLPVIYPSSRHGRYVAQRMVKFMTEAVAPAPDQCYTLNDGTLSADLVSLSGRIRIAQAKGEVAKFKMSESHRVAMKRYMEDIARRPQEMSEFFNRMVDHLRGKRVFIFGTTNIIYQAAAAGLARGIDHVFTADSVACTGGGGKDVVLPPDWPQQIHKFTGIPHWRMNYAMTEMIGMFTGCPQGRYHATPYTIPFVLDPETGVELPRNGIQTGRLGLLDLLAQTYWGGIITGDMVTIDWDSGCPCGRKGAFFHDTIARYATNVTGDDKITCAATIDNTDAALQKLLAG